MSRAQKVTRALGGAWRGQHGTACCPSHEDRSPSLSLRDGHDGRLLIYCHAGCSFVSVADALRAQGLMPTNTNHAPSGAVSRICQAKAAKEAKAASERRARLARELWEQAIPIQGTLGERYIRLRGITCPLPYTLRYIGDCWHHTGQRFPAMVARVEGGEGFAVHRTYIKPDGSGKAEVQSPKVMLGRVKRGAVRLSQPAGSMRRVAVAEGIETALSLRCGLLGAQTEVRAALSATGMKNMQLPATAGELVLAPDGDRVGRAAAEVLTERAEQAGWRITWMHPPHGMDWNDVLRGGAFNHE